VLQSACWLLQAPESRKQPNSAARPWTQTHHASPGKSRAKLNIVKYNKTTPRVNWACPVVPYDQGLQEEESKKPHTSAPAITRLHADREEPYSLSRHANFWHAEPEFLRTSAYSAAPVLVLWCLIAGWAHAEAILRGAITWFSQSPRKIRFWDLSIVTFYWNQPINPRITMMTAYMINTSLHGEELLDLEPYGIYKCQKFTRNAKEPFSY